MFQPTSPSRISRLWKPPHRKTIRCPSLPSGSGPWGLHPSKKTQSIRFVVCQGKPEMHRAMVEDFSAIFHGAPKIEGLPGLAVYAEYPQQNGQAWLSQAYTEGTTPAARILPLHAWFRKVPMRKNHSLLQSGQSCQGSGRSKDDSMAESHKSPCCILVRTGWRCRTCQHRSSNHCSSHRRCYSSRSKQRSSRHCSCSKHHCSKHHCSRSHCSCSSPCSRSKRHCSQRHCSSQRPQLPLRPSQAAKQQRSLCSPQVQKCLRRSQVPSRRPWRTLRPRHSWKSRRRSATPKPRASQRQKPKRSPRPRPRPRPRPLPSLRRLPRQQRQGQAGAQGQGPEPAISASIGPIWPGEP